MSRDSPCKQTHSNIEPHFREKPQFLRAHLRVIIFIF